MLGQATGLLREPGQALSELRPGRCAVAVLLGGAPEQLPADLFQPLFHLGVVGEVQLLELVDEPDQPVERALMHAGLAGLDAVQHVVAQLSGLFAQRRHALRHERLHVRPDFRASRGHRLLPGRDELLLVRRRHEVHPETFRHRDLEQLLVEPEGAFQPLHGRERRLDGGDEPLRVFHQLAGHREPFLDGILPESAIAFDELLLGLPELGFEFPELRRHFSQPGVGKEVRQAVEERERVGFDERMGAAFRQRERGRRVFGEEPFVPERNQSLGHRGGFQPDIFRTEPFAAAPVSDRYAEKNPFTREHFEQMRM